ncbi:MAG: hypothetical protein HN396_18175 [Gemmatimonadales bacterium]|nr:hypothetical protein [Gemmatimonadales bacterium]
MRRYVILADHKGLATMAAALDVIRRTPVGSTDQRLTRARALLGLKNLRALFGMVQGEEELDRAVNETLEWLPAVVTGSGYVSDWPGSSGRILLTAATLHFLVEAAEAGYEVDDKLAGRLTSSLKGALRSDHVWFIDGESWYERSAALEALASTGTFDGAYWSELARRARTMSAEGTANVLLAGVRNGTSNTPAGQELVKVLNGSVTTQLYQGVEIYAGLKESRTDRNALIVPSEARTLAHITRALTRAGANTERVDLMVDALVQVGSGDGWGNTNANGAALQALSDWASTSTNKSLEATLMVGQHKETLVLKGAHMTSFSTEHDGKMSLALAEPFEGAVALELSSWVPLPDGSHEAADANGFVVTRTWEIVAEDGPTTKRPLEAAGETIVIDKGVVVEEHVSVVAPAERHYVVVTVPLAAGMEPLNPALAISGPEATPSGKITLEASWSQYLDDRVTFVYETLPKGTYDFYFRTRATTPGSFVQPAAHTVMLYDSSVEGHSPGARIEVTDE